MHVLFLSHEASRTGAPIALLHFMRYLKENTDITFSIILKHAGGLHEEMRKLAPLYLYADIIKDQSPRDKIIQNVSLIYANTVGVHEILALFDTKKVPILAHIHELETVIRIFKGETLWKKFSITHYIAASRAVKDNLVRNHGIETNDITVIHETIPNINTQEILGRSNAIRTLLGIPLQDFIVGSVGSVEWRKGADLLTQIALAVRAKRNTQPIHFIWIGAPFNKEYIANIRQKIQQEGLSKTVRFIGPRLNRLDYMGIFDAFIMLSREDPFPLVMLEAAALQKPILCFQGSGGCSEFVERNNGYVVPYEDTTSMANKLCEIQKNPTDAQKRGRMAQSNFIRNFEIQTVAPRMIGLIKKYHVHAR